MFQVTVFYVKVYYISTNRNPFLIKRSFFYFEKLALIKKTFHTNSSESRKKNLPVFYREGKDKTTVSVEND